MYKGIAPEFAPAAPEIAIEATPLETPYAPYVSPGDITPHIDMDYLTPGAPSVGTIIPDVSSALLIYSTT